MQPMIRGFGRLAKKADIKLGDLFAVGRGDGSLSLCLAVEPHGAMNQVLILETLGESEPDDLPRAENFDLVVQSDDLVRILDDELTIEPIAAPLRKTLADVRDVPLKNGLLVLYADGELGIYVRPTPGPARIFSLNTGKQCDASRPRHIAHWTLTWGTDSPKKLFQR